MATLTPTQSQERMRDLLNAAEAENEEKHTCDVRVGTGSVDVPEVPEHWPVAYPDPFMAFANHFVVWRGDHPFTIRFQFPSPAQGVKNLTAVKLQDPKDRNRKVHIAVARMHREAAKHFLYKYDLEVRHPVYGQLIADPTGNVDPDPV